MTEKMTIDKARKIGRKLGEKISDFYGGYHRGFIKGYESREAEIEELKSQNQEMRKALEKVRLHFNPSDVPGGYLTKDRDIYRIIFDALKEVKE